MAEVLEGLQLEADGSVSSHLSAAPSSVYPNGANRIANESTNGSTDAHVAESDAMDVSPISPSRAAAELGQPMDVAAPAPGPDDAAKDQTSAPQANGHTKLRLFSKNRKGGVLGMFGLGDKGHQNTLAPVDELNVASTSMQPLGRTTTSSTDSRSVPDLSPDGDNIAVEPAVPQMDAKARKKEAQRIMLEAEKERRAMQEKRSREQARAVMQKRNQMLKQRQVTDFEWDSSNTATLLGVHKPPKSKSRSNAGQASSSTATINAAGGRFRSATDVGSAPDFDHLHELEHRTKARRRDLDDDHSMSSSDLQSVSRMSMMSFATAESDPIQSRLRPRPNMFGIARMQSSTSLRTSFGDDFSARSSDSPSFEHHDYDSRASMSSYEAARSSMSEASSPLPMHSLSLSSPQQQQAQAVGRHPFITLPLPMSHQHLRAATPGSPYEYGQYGQIQAQPPSPAIAPHSAINPIFKVVSAK